MTHHDTVTHMEADKNSYEFGKAGNRFKLYFTTISELVEHLEALKKWGFPVDSAFAITNKKGVESDDTNNNELK